MTDLDCLSLLLAVSAAALMGFSKTALPAAAIAAVAINAAAFPSDAQMSVGAMLPMLLAGDVLAVARFRRHAQWNRLLGLFPFVVLGMVPGYLVLAVFEGNQLRPILGWLVLALVAVELARQRFGWKSLPEQWWFNGAAGVLAGFGTTVGNAGGPVMNLYLLSRDLVKEQFVGTCAWFFFLLNLTKVLPFWSQGMLTRQTVSFGLMMVPAVLAGGLLGIWLLPRIPQRMFNALISLLAAAAGAWLLW